MLIVEQQEGIRKKNKVEFIFASNVRGKFWKKSQLPWPFTIVQNDNITISWDNFRLTAPAAMPGHLGAVSLKKSHYIIILSFCNIVMGQANYPFFSLVVKLSKVFTL